MPKTILSIFILFLFGTFLGGDLIQTSKIKNFLRLMPCTFTGPKMICARPNFFSQPKNLNAFSASSKTFVPTQKTILLNANHLVIWHKMFVTATIFK
jgi:hypothetical protein